jgi:hypothetical protein
MARAANVSAPVLSFGPHAGANLMVSAISIPSTPTASFERTVVPASTRPFCLKPRGTLPKLRAILRQAQPRDEMLHPLGINPPDIQRHRLPTSARIATAGMRRCAAFQLDHGLDQDVAGTCLSTVLHLVVGLKNR